MRIDGKKEGLRQSMSWLHTYTGILLGWLLFAIFFTGTWSYFRNEINDWMHPKLHHLTYSEEESITTAFNYLQTHAPNASSWNINLPSNRSLALEIWYREPAQGGKGRGAFKSAYLDAKSGNEVIVRPSNIANLIYRFHFELHGISRILGRFIVGFATMMMLIAIISGAVTHKKIFSDFFTFRPKKGQRSWLDAHNATAVMALPFCFVITFSGLVLLVGTIMPFAGYGIYKSGAPARTNAQLTTNAAEHIQAPTLNDINKMIIKAKTVWNFQQVSAINISNPNTAKALVTINDNFSDKDTYLAQSSRGGRSLQFDALSLKLTKSSNNNADVSFVRQIRNVIVGVHEGRFAGVIVRWLLFISGILGTLMVATGLILWVVKRLPKRRKLGTTPIAHRLVEIFNVSAIAGLSIAFGASFWLNRILPFDLPNRADWEAKGFFIIWFITLIHASMVNHKKSWLQQLFLATFIYISIPLLNALTGGSSMWHNILYGKINLLNIEFALLVCAFIYGTALWWMLRSKAVISNKTSTITGGAKC